jgi:transketolase
MSIQKKEIKMNQEALKDLALSIRALSMDGVQKANSGHPGLPLGMADTGAVLFGSILKHNPKDPGWINRDRFILSAGHGSMLIYSLLHLTGYNLPLEELKQFRQVGSKTPGHPEFGLTAGIETTTGPLGQGLANAVGFAMAERHLAARLNTDKHPIIDHYTYAIAGDGCLMEGVSAEASSAAGHLGLGKLIVFYDSNKITIEGSTDLAFTESVKKRYEAYGWQVLEGSAHDMNDVAQLTEAAQKETGKPSLVILKSTIGYGSPNKAGTHGVHGAPLGAEEVVLTKKALGIPEDKDFYISPKVAPFIEEKLKQWSAAQESWEKLFKEWAATSPEKKALWDDLFSEKDLRTVPLPQFEVGSQLATRKAGGAALKAFSEALPGLVGGSADLAPSNNSNLAYGSFTADYPQGRTIHFGVREHAMGAMVNGMTLHSGLKVFGATFLVFSDYMRPPIRLASLMKIPSIFLYTHDSIFVGEDGPTHQPVEHFAALRAIPGLLVLRPGDAEETQHAWRIALSQRSRPSAILLTRQNLKVYAKDDQNWAQTIDQGAYIVKDQASPEVILVATGSEVNLALEAAELSQKRVKVISMLSKEIFQEQEQAFQESLINPGTKVVVAEVGIAQGWHDLAQDVSFFGMNSFGESGPGQKVAEHFGITAENLAKVL